MRASLLRLLLGLLALAAVCGAGPARAASYTATANASTASSYPWIDISSTGTALALADDGVSAALPLGFTFTFGSTAYTSVKVMSNGMLQFAGNTTAYANSALPMNGTSGEPAIDAAMLPLWDDLSPGTGQVRYRTQGTAPNRVFIVSWNAVPYYGASAGQKATFQVQLYEQGQFVYRYGTVDGSGGAHTNSSSLSNPGGATVGMEVADGDFVQYARNTASVPSGTTILWARAPTPAPMLEYLFNQTSWNGTSGEVKDSSASGYHGTAAGLSATKPSTVSASPAVGSTSGTCQYGVFNRANKDYVALPSSFPNLGSSSFSVTAWIRTTDNTQPGQRIFADDQNNTTGIGMSLGDGGAGKLRFLSRGTASATALDTGAVISNNTWYFVAFVLDASGKTKTIVVYNTAGTLVTSVSQAYTEANLGNTDGGTASIGGENNAAGGEATSSFGFAGNIDEVRIYNAALSSPDFATIRALTHTCAAAMDHLEIRLSGASPLTCTPSTFTLAACKDAACAAPYTGGVTGTLTATGAGMSVSWPAGASFSIPAGSGSTTLSMQLLTAGSVTMGATSLSPTPVNTTSCNFGSPSCTYTAAAAALQFVVPDHVAETSNTVSISAVGSSGGTCASIFANKTRSITFKCSYTNPGTGTKPVRVGGAALNSGNSAAAACDGTGRSVSLVFNASGVASTTVQYADVGQMLLTGSYTGSFATGDSGLTMTGSDGFIAAPASFGFSAITAAPIKAGSAFSATVSALNSAGATTPNFGRETVPEGALISFTAYQPGGAGSSGGSFSGNLGAFAGGSATASNLAWTEVGTGDLSAQLNSGSYLGTGFDASGSTGSTGAVGRFIPHHFDIGATAACGGFSYAGQPFSVTVTARNAAGGTTVNYDGSAATSPNFAKAVTLSDASALGVGSLAGNTLAAGAFTAGVASATPSYTFSSKTTPAKTLVLRATDSDGVSSSGYAEPGMGLRSGRLRLSNAFGSAGASLQVPMVAEYWSGSSWVLNSADSCTALPAASVALSNLRSASGGSSSTTTSASAASLSSGSGVITLSAPSPAGSSLTLDLALNLGGSSTDQSCQASHPASTGAGLAWLRAQNGACAATADRDPAARASFGIFSPETRKTVHVREIF